MERNISNACDGDDQKGNKLVRIVSLMNTYLSLNEEGIKSIFDQHESEDEVEGPPLIILSVVGDRNSGKSFLLNILMHYLKYPETGNWMSEFIKQGVDSSGFKVNNIIKTENPAMIDSGLYAWPQCIPYKDPSTGNRVNILLLDIQAGNPADYSSLSKLCVALSSTIVSNDADSFKAGVLDNLSKLSSFMIENRTQLKLHLGLTEDQIPTLCNHFNFVIRDFQHNSKFPWGKEDKARKYVKDVVSTNFSSLFSYFEKVEETSSFFLLKPPDNDGIQLNTNGELIMDSKLATQLKTMCQNIMETAVEKQIRGLSLTKFTASCVEIVNFYYMTTATMAHSPRGETHPNQNNTGTEINIETGSVVINADEDAEMTDVSDESIILSTSDEAPSSAFNNSSIPSKPTVAVKMLSPLMLSKVAEGTITNDGFKPASSSMQHPIHPNPSIEENSECHLMANVTLRDLRSSSPSVHVSSTCEKRNSQLRAASNESRQPSPMPSTQPLRSRREIDDIVIPKISALLQNYKTAMNQAGDIDAAHLDNSRKVINDFRGVLCDIQIEGNQKQQELIRQLENNLNLEYKKLKNVASKIVTKNNAPTILKSNAITDISDIPTPAITNNGDMLVEEPKAIETNIDDGLGVEEMDTTEKNDLDPTESSILPEHHVAESKPKWVDGLISEYMNVVDDSLRKNFNQNLFVANEDFDRHHINTINKLNKELTSMLNKKWSWPTKKNGIPSVLKDEQNQAAVEGFILAHGLESQGELRQKMRNANEQRSAIYTDFVQRCKNKLNSDFSAWIRNVTNIMANSHNRDSSTEFINKTLRAVSSSFHTQPRNHCTLMENEFKQSLGFKQYAESLSHIEKCFNLYRKEMDKKIEMNRCLSSQKLSDAHDKIMESVMKNFNCTFDNAEDKMMAGLEQFHNQYSKLCKEINQCEIQAADKLIQTMKPYYRDNMDTMTKGQFFMPEMLRKLHGLIVQETIDAFWKTCDFKVNQEIPADITSHLVQHWEDQFEHFVTQNNVKAEKARLKAKKLLNEHRKMYNSGMDTILPSRGPSRDQKELEKEHNQIMKETCKLFEMEMSNMEVKISHKEEASILINNIMQDWEELKKLNVKLQENERAAERKKREQEERQQREIEKESKKKEAELIARDQEVAAEEKKREKQKIAKQQEKNKPRTSSNLLSISVTTEPNKLPTIAIEFGYTRVRVGLMVADQFQMIKDMPAEVAVDRDGEVFIGQAANVYSDKFALRDAFTGISMNQQHSCFIDGLNQKVRMEVLVALFFAKLKADVEEQQSGQWTRAVITVPLGFTSVQRQLMKDAAFMARFEATQIMNDTTAAAVCFSQTKDYSLESLLLVGVDHNHGLNFDAALYDWSNFGKFDYQLCMEASCGNLHSSAKDNGLIATFKEFCTETVYRQWWCGKKEIDGVRKMIKNMISTKDVTANACISYGSTSGNEAFRNVINKHGRTAVNAELFIVQGAAMVSQNLPIECDWPTKMPFKDKAVYAIQRTSTTYHSKPDVIISEKQQPLTSVSCNVDSTLGVIESQDYQIMIRGSSQGNQQHQIGCLVVKSACIYDDICRRFRYPPEVKVRFLLSNEGILSFENAFVMSGGRSVEVIASEWMSSNIDQSKREEFRAQAASIMNDKKKMAFKKSKEELEALITELQPLIGDVKKPIGKRMLEEGVESSEKMLAHPKTTHEQVEKKIEYLNGLRCKYLK